MSTELSNTRQVQQLLERMDRGDHDAREQLLEMTCGRLNGLVRKMLRNFPTVQRWEQTDDVFQNATLRLLRALDGSIPSDARHFFRLAAMQIRRELIDLSRRYQGPLGLANHHVSQRPTADGSDSSDQFNLAEGCETTNDPQALFRWSEFHQQVEQLPEEQREVFDLLWYHELSQTEAADALGVSTRTIKRHWQAARLSLHDRLGQVGEF
jgi:RNA polymerase sigma factor (sigma-70 family)